MKREDVKPGVRVAWVGPTCAPYRAVVDGEPTLGGIVPLRDVEVAYSKGNWGNPSIYTSPHFTWLRRLKPAKKRRRIWVTEHALSQLWKSGRNTSDGVVVSKNKVVHSDVEFIEVRRKAGEAGK